MTDTVTPAAAVAAPAASAAAPAVAAPAAAAAPTTVSTPAPVAAAGAVTTGEASLLDVAAAPAAAAEPTEAEKLAAATALVEANRLAADPNAPQAWNLDSTVLGKGEKPSWFKADKYKSVAAQAEAYVALESRLGSFVGAPKDGKYEWKAPENASDAVKSAKFDMENPLFKGFNEWATKAQLSQDGYNQVLGMLAQYEANNAPNPAKAKADIGANADARITAVGNWAKANLEAAEQAALWDATRGKNAAVVFKAIESLIAKTGQVKMPGPGADTAGGGGVTKESLDAMQGAKNEKGQRLYDVDPTYRQKVFQARVEYAKANPTNRDRQGNIRG